MTATPAPTPPAVAAEDAVEGRLSTRCGDAAWPSRAAPEQEGTPRVMSTASCEAGEGSGRLAVTRRCELAQACVMSTASCEAGGGRGGREVTLRCELAGAKLA